MKHQANDPFRVMELFGTIQGEGTDIGRETVFIRLYGCNLKCVWCDTAHSWDESKYFEGIYTEKTHEQLLNEIIPLNIKHVVITGGEPLTHSHEALYKLVHELRFLRGIHTTFETNGTLLPSHELAAETGLFSVSPKLQSSGNPPFRAGMLDKWMKFANRSNCNNIQFKFVIANIHDAMEVAELIEGMTDTYKSLVPIIFQPEESADNYKELPVIIGEAFDRLGLDKTRFNIRYIPQVHKLFQIR